MEAKKLLIPFFVLLFITGIYRYIVINSTRKLKINYDSPSNKINYKPDIHKLNNSKWIVVTSILKPTEQLKQLVAIPNWKVVVVGDKKTPKDWNYTDCIFLSVDDQMKLGYQITKHLPYNSYTRKMIGYLFAIDNGAQFIYDTDDDNCPSKGELEFQMEPVTSGLIYTNLDEPVINPLSHFGQPKIWPRGFPLERITDSPNFTYTLCNFNTPAIQQGLVNGDPDVDAIYRLINKGSNTRLNINVTFDTRAPPFTLPQGVFAPFNSQNTFFSYNAFWALFLPTTVDFRVTDIWRGYWAQRLLWLTGQYLAFHPPNAVQIRNAHSYIKDFQEEIQMYEESNKLIDFLSQWQCNSSIFFQCVEWLTADMVKQQFIKDLDLNIVKLWLSDLKKVGYQEPIKAENPLEKMCLPSEIKKSTWVNYSPAQVSPNAGFNDLLSMCEKHIFYNHSKKEDILKHISSDKPQNSFTFENILLVIVFNAPFLRNVRMLEVLYRDHFPNMLFCGESNNLKELMELINNSSLNWRKNDISFVNATELHYGWFGYECAIRSIEMNYNVDGYMFLGDDVFLKPWKLLPFDSSRSRIQNDTYAPHCYQNLTNSTSVRWQLDFWWYKTVGYKATNKAFEEIDAIAKNVSDYRSSIFQIFIKNRFSNGVNMSLVSTGMSDFYYISKQDSWMFAQVLKIFFKNKVFLEIAVPSTLSGCRKGDPQTNDGFLGTSIWFSKRVDPLKYFTNKTIYIHPLKLANLEDDEKLLKKYCLKFVHDYLSEW